MDGCPNESAAVHSLSRKRKADADTCQPQEQPSDAQDIPSPDPIILDHSAATPRIPTKLVTQHAHGLASWQRPQLASPALVTTFAVHVRQEGPSKPKRPRIEIPQSIPPSSRRVRRGRALNSSILSPSRRYPRHPRTHDIRDTGVVSAIEPRRVSLLCPGSISPPLPSPLPPHRTHHSVPVTPVEPSALCIPPHQPPINRITLKELDLEAILRNPQLRHDLLFDPGLQFRPTFSRRKRDIADNYWAAVLRELSTGCTCTTFDANGKPCERRCICSSVPLPTGRAISVFASTGDFMTLRSPSRLKPLLCELLEVLISIIQPPITQPAGLTVRPQLLHPQYQQNASHVSYLRSILDADLIQQEIEHGLFDPSGVFQAVGDIIRCYCAPMRDHIVDQMVSLARSCAPGGTGSKLDAVRAIRQCFEIMELMKLDVANHQLQTLRPYLVHSAAQFELQMFQENKQKGPLTLDATQRWLQSAFDELEAENVVGGPQEPSIPAFVKYPRGVQIQIAVTRAIVNLIFDSSTSFPSSPLSPSTANLVVTTAGSGYPETLYLDHARLATLRTDAADFTALYMLLMLFRQLVHSVSSLKKDGSRAPVKHDELLAIKKEIWEVGPAHLGYCYVHPSPKAASSSDSSSDNATDTAKWGEEIGNVVLQLTARASEARPQPSIPLPSSSLCPVSSTSTTISSSSPRLPQSTTIPDPSLLKLATSWTETNLQADAPLSVLMRKRIRRVVEETTVQLLVPSSPSRKTGAQDGASAAVSGLEPLMPEIRHLAEKLKKLVTIHLNVYGTLYAQPGFLKDQQQRPVAAETAIANAPSTPPR